MAKIKEIWKAVPEYEGDYEVSNLGNVRSFKRINLQGRILVPMLINSGYLTVDLSKKNRRKKLLIHILVIKAFCKHDPSLVVDHINQDRKDNRLINLRQVTQRENSSNKRPNCSSKYIGVFFCNTSKKWRSVIKIKDKIKHLGYFINEKKAAKVYSLAVEKVVEGKEIGYFGKNWYEKLVA